MKRWVKCLVVSLICALIVCLAGCASVQSSCKSCAIDRAGGTDRIIRIYDYQGDVIAEYDGFIWVEEQDSGTNIMFELDGKRYIYYNAIFEIIEK